MLSQLGSKVHQITRSSTSLSLPGTWCCDQLMSRSICFAFFYSSKQPYVKLVGLVTYLQVEEHSCWMSLNLLSFFSPPLLQVAVCWLWPSRPEGLPAAVAAAGNQSLGLFFQGIQHAQLQGSGGTSKHGLDQGSQCAAGGKDVTNKAIPSACLCTEQAGAMQRCLTLCHYDQKAFG